MNDLDRQLAELALMNKTELKPSPSTGTLGKKVGPAVPPKPKKTQPQIPQSYPLKQTVEPSYASRLQTNQFYSNVPSPSAQSHYSNTPTLPMNAKYHPQQPLENNYVNLGIDCDQSSQYSNLPRSVSAMSNVSNLSRQDIVARLAITFSGNEQVPSEYTPKQCSSPRQNMVPKGYVKPDHVTYSNIQVGQHRNQDGLIYSNLMHPPREDVNVYGNRQPNNSAYANGDDLPPPPPPLDMTSGLADYAPCTVNTNLPPPPEDLLPPPSPVSSSYSELRRATQPGQDFHGYSMGSQCEDCDSLYAFGGMSQSSSTYESIYEPINPRPPSQLSARSNYSLYAGSTLTGPSQSASRIGMGGTPTAGSQSTGRVGMGGTMTAGSQSTGRVGMGGTMAAGSQSVGRLGDDKEREVDSLTDMLVRGMDGGAGGAGEGDQEDVYGVCVKCGEKIIGENSGCTAMDQLYHTKCFTCHHCAINLQGKPFYALDGNPYCEEDYLNTLEKCCVCQNPILDRILRATGKPYHPKCFCCVVCGKSLDGIPFTVDATNRVHCIEDFHKIFAPRCWVCKQPIMPEPGEEETVRVVALDHSFHIQCYKCEDCGLVLSSEAEGRGCYPLDGHVLCKSCNAKRVQALTSHMTTEL
ncbi:unnamed protein product [Phaedon cochleariae]|uniref:LIM zinc-binding domain-containing protein n=1 Tax=Phaedon cochleariae TaxID=80249 RepID=A0A9N9S9W1_PHACE|nr:unnamed protein product [Phaedon cochleariae]